MALTDVILTKGDHDYIKENYLRNISEGVVLESYLSHSAKRHI